LLVTSPILAEVLGTSLPSIASFLKKAMEDRKIYTERLEKAKGDDIFRYLLLAESASLDQYVQQTRLQAQESFILSKRVAVVGFALIAIGIILGILAGFVGTTAINAAYLASLAGILTEFISGVFFYLFNRTLQQLNLFHDKMLASRQVIMSFLANTLIEDGNKRDDSKVELSKLLISGSARKE